MKPRLFSSHAASAALPPRSRPRPGGIVAATACAVAALAAVPAFGQVAVTLNGPPVQVRPYVPEPGLPDVTIPLGTLNPFPSDPSGGGSPGDPSGGGSPAVVARNVASSDSLSTMLSQPWGIAAVANAQSLGVNPSALAGDVRVGKRMPEHWRGRIGPRCLSDDAGDLHCDDQCRRCPESKPRKPDRALALAGLTDPATESIAASEYLLQGAQALQAAGVSNPTVLQTRGYYNFGPTSGTAFAHRRSESNHVCGNAERIARATLAKNGVTPGETVAQWQAAVAAKIGTAAGQSVIET